jgi:large subunit ribosomal protein L25
MIQVNLSASQRAAFGKGACRRLRVDKKTPAVLYGKGDTAVSLQLDEAALYKELLFIHGRNAVVTLDVEGDATRHVLIQDIQKAPMGEQVLHVDFLEIDINSPMTFDVSLRLTGAAKGVEFGGELIVSKDSVVLRGRPLDIPDEIVADITELEIGGKGLLCADLVFPTDLEMLDNPEQVCAAVH